MKVGTPYFSCFSSPILPACFPTQASSFLAAAAIFLISYAAAAFASFSLAALLWAAEFALWAFFGGAPPSIPTSVTCTVMKPYLVVAKWHEAAELYEPESTHVAASSIFALHSPPQPSTSLPCTSKGYTLCLSTAEMTSVSIPGAVIFWSSILGVGSSWSLHEDCQSPSKT